MILASPLVGCSVCAHPFTRRSTMQTVCSLACTLKQTAKKAREAKKAAADDRRKTRAQLEALKPRSKWLKEAQTAFNAYIRCRDGHLPCISCGRHHGGQYHAGHYLTVGARPELRFDELNVHKQCAPCNEHLHGNLVLYRVELLQRIGAEAVARLEGPHPPRKYTVPELRELRDGYRAKTRALQAAA